MAILGDIFGAGGIASLGKEILQFTGRFFPDKAEAQKEAAALQEKILSIDAELAKEQIEVNKIEAANPSVFVAGWRPAVGWIGALTLALIYWPKAIVLCVFWCLATYHAYKVSGPLPPYPDLGAGDLIGILGSMLGMGGMRTLEKLKGVQTSGVGK